MAGRFYLVTRTQAHRENVKSGWNAEKKSTLTQILVGTSPLSLSPSRRADLPGEGVNEKLGETSVKYVREFSCNFET